MSLLHFCQQLQSTWLSEAISQYQKAIELQPRMFEPYANLALIYMRRNQAAEAQKYLAEARKLNPDLKIPNE